MKLSKAPEIPEPLESQAQFSGSAHPIILNPPSKGTSMAKKPNYGYEKRQKELARQAKKEEKRKRKNEEKSEDPSAEDSH